MSGKNVHEMDTGAPALATDELYATRSPYEVGDDVKLSMQDVADFVNEATNVHGTLALGNGVSSGSVTGLDLDYDPISVLLTVQSPVGGGVIVACLVGAPTTDGFDFALTGMTDSSNYVLHYHLYLV